MNYTIGTYFLSEDKKNEKRRRKKQIEQKRLRKIFKPTDIKIKKIYNDLTVNIYKYRIDKKNKLFAVTYQDLSLDNNTEIYKYKKLNKNWFPVI